MKKAGEIVLRVIGALLVGLGLLFLALFNWLTPDDEEE